MINADQELDQRTLQIKIDASNKIKFFWLSRNSSGSRFPSLSAKSMLNVGGSLFEHTTKIAEVSTTGYWKSNSQGTFFSHKLVNCKIGLALYKPVLAQLSCEKELSMSDEALITALTTGFFQVTVPDDLLNHINIILNFLTSFSEKKEFSNNFNSEHPEVFEHLILGFMVDDKKILSDDQIGQTEQLNQVCRLNLKKDQEHNFWQYLPLAIQHALEEYKNFKNSVLIGILNKLGIRNDLYSPLTCGVSEGLGAEYALFNDFRPNIRAKHGLKEHKDYGIITALCSPVYCDDDVDERSGLEAYIDYCGKKQWVSIAPHEKAIIFNFGSTLEKALEQYEIKIGNFSVKLNAAVHRVKLCDKSRYSFVNFGDPPSSASIKRLIQQNDEQFLEGDENYLAHCSEENEKLYTLR